MVVGSVKTTLNFVLKIWEMVENITTQVTQDH